MKGHVVSHPSRSCRLQYDNMQHGFAIRGDDSDPETKAAKEDCLETTYAFMVEALGV